MTIKIRNAKTLMSVTYENVKHFQICSTGPRPNTKTLIMSCRYDRDDEFMLTMDEHEYICIDE